MPRNPPKPVKPKLHGLSSEDFKDWYQELDEWHRELDSYARSQGRRMGVKKRKKPPWFTRVEHMTETAANALAEMDMRGELADAGPGKKGVVRIGNRWQAGRGGRGSKKV